MTPIDQTRFGKPHGNCLAAAVASVLELPLDSVPDLNATDVHQLIVLNDWLRQFDLQFTWVPWDTYTGHRHSFFLVSGESPRGLRHTVVCNERGELAHDPHPSRAGIAQALECGLFIATCPQKLCTDARPVDTPTPVS